MCRLLATGDRDPDRKARRHRQARHDQARRRSTQATYNGHPLYTYVGDTRPGQANGDNLNLNGGLWHEVIAGAGRP